VRDRQGDAARLVEDPVLAGSTIELEIELEPLGAGVDVRGQLEAPAGPRRRAVVVLRVVAVGSQPSAR
jgi:hypothetical protein